MAHTGFGHLWQQPEHSDVNILICVAADGPDLALEPQEHDMVQGQDLSLHHDADNQQLLLLRQFPGHNAILSSSRYFAAQVRCMVVFFAVYALCQNAFMR